MLIKIHKKYKIFGGIMISDNMLGVLLFVIIMAAAFLKWDTLVNFGRWGSEWMEMQNMKSAASTYQGLRTDGSSPTSATDLVTGVTADQSIDGTPHEGLMSAKTGRWKNGAYTDAWGNDFVFSIESDGSRSITSGGVDGKVGSSDDIVVYY